MSGVAQQEEIFAEESYQATGTESVAGLKQMASEKLEAHRRRRAAAGGKSEVAEAAPVVRRTGSSRVREAVAARYQNSVTYREFLAQEAERALEQAEAEAEVAARKVQAVAEAQMQLMEELREWEQPGPREVVAAEHPFDTLAHAVAATDSMMHDSEAFTAGLTVRLYEDLSAARPPVEGARNRAAYVEHEPDEHEALDAEIAFRRAPEFDEHQPLPVGISGNLIEFPRQLVAARKARPRLAEGPLREESAPEPQLRIFEVEPEQISTVLAEPEAAPEWQGMLMDSVRTPEPVIHVQEQFHHTLLPQTARLELRLMAAVVDACFVGTGMVGFVAVVAQLAGPALRALPLPMAGTAVGVVVCVLFVMYQLLFFTLGEATPGMRYARIGLCTFADGNPTRKAMRRRVLATMLAASPLGLGLAWAWMDEDGLGWHDRISRMYQRAY